MSVGRPGRNPNQLSVFRYERTVASLPILGDRPLRSIKTRRPHPAERPIEPRAQLDPVDHPRRLALGQLAEECDSLVQRGSFSPGQVPRRRMQDRALRPRGITIKTIFKVQQRGVNKYRIDSID